MKKGQDVSVVIPVRDYGEFVGEAIESVLKQTVPPGEVIVVDDGSVDNTAEVVRGYSPEVKYVYLDRKGIGAARNLGVELSTSEYIAHLDADDTWVPEKLEVQIEEFLKDPVLEIAGGMMQPFYDQRLDPEKRSGIICSDTPLPGFSASVILVKRSSFIRAGRYREDVTTGQDLDWFLRAREVPLKEKMVNRLLAYRRLHRYNSTADKKPGNTARIKLLKESLDRRRKMK